jgi:integrase
MPVTRLTAANVKTLPPRGQKRTDYTDAILPGFVLRVSPTGARSYAVSVWSRGRKRRVSLGPITRTPLVTAREYARRVIETLSRGEEPAPLEAGPDPLTVARLVRRCLDDITLRETTRTEWERLASREIVPALGPRRAAAVRRADIREWLRPIAARSKHTARHALELLRRCYTWGVREDLLAASPCVGLEPPGRTSGDRVLSADELWALQRALDRGGRRYPAYAAATRLLLLTAVRRSAVLGMRRSELEDLDGREPRWIVPAERMKGGRAHVVPLSPAAVAIVRERMKACTTEHLFPLGHGTKRQDCPMGWSGTWRSWLRRRLARALNARRRVAGLGPVAVPRWRTHDLRHAAATHLREDLGVRPDVVSLLLSHAPAGPSVSRIYNRAELLAERRAALEAWALWLAEHGPRGRQEESNTVSGNAPRETSVVSTRDADAPERYGA